MALLNMVSKPANDVIDDVAIAVEDERQRWLVDYAHYRELEVERLEEVLFYEAHQWAELDKEALTDRVDRRWRPPVYADYLRSRDWQARAERAKRSNRCILCNKRGRLEAHHPTYQNLGRELPGDLVPLCGPCHARHHGKERAR